MLGLGSAINKKFYDKEEKTSLKVKIRTLVQNKKK